MSCLPELPFTCVAVPYSIYGPAGCRITRLSSHLAWLLQGFVHILLEGTWLWFPKLMQNKQAHMWIYELCECLFLPG